MCVCVCIAVGALRTQRKVSEKRGFSLIDMVDSMNESMNECWSRNGHQKNNNGRKKNKQHQIMNTIKHTVWCP